jgi:hypothetical protein
MSDDWRDDEWYVKYIDHFLADVLPVLQDSAFSVSIVPGPRNQNRRGDAKYWTELGAMIMHDKPIIAIIEPGTEVPERLVRVADVIIEGDITTEAGQQVIQEKLAVAVAKMEEEGY